jgi:hypothetical protein
MKKVTTVIAALLFMTSAASAQTSYSSYTNYIDTLATEGSVTSHIQFFLGGDVILTKNGRRDEMIVKKHGVVEILDRRITFEPGLPGILDHIDSVNGEKVLWIKYEKGKKNHLTTIILPFISSGKGKDNAYKLAYPSNGSGGSMLLKKTGAATYFKNDDDKYTFEKSTDLQVDASFLQSLIKARGIKIK